MMRKMFAGSTSESIPIYVQNSAGGGGFSGLVFNTTGLAAAYRRQGQATWTPITLQTMTLGTWSTGGLIADGPNPGFYELGLPNAAIAAGVEWVEVQLYGAGGMAVCAAFIELDAINYVTGQLPAAGLDLIVTEGAINLPQAVALAMDGIVSVLSGVPSSGAGTILIKDPTGAHTRASIAVDGAGNRTASTLTPPSV